MEEGGSERERGRLPPCTWGQLLDWIEDLSSQSWSRGTQDSFLQNEPCFLTTDVF